MRELAPMGLLDQSPMGQGSYFNDYAANNQAWRDSWNKGYDMERNPVGLLASSGDMSAQQFNPNPILDLAPGMNPYEGGRDNYEQRSVPIWDGTNFDGLLDGEFAWDGQWTGDKQPGGTQVATAGSLNNMGIQQPTAGMTPAMEQAQMWDLGQKTLGGASMLMGNLPLSIASFLSGQYARGVSNDAYRGKAPPVSLWDDLSQWDLTHGSPQDQQQAIVEGAAATDREIAAAAQRAQQHAVNDTSYRTVGSTGRDQKDGERSFERSTDRQSGGGRHE